MLTSLASKASLPHTVVKLCFNVLRDTPSCRRSTLLSRNNDANCLDVKCFQRQALATLLYVEVNPIYEHYPRTSCTNGSFPERPSWRS